MKIEFNEKDIKTIRRISRIWFFETDEDHEFLNEICEEIKRYNK